MGSAKIGVEPRFDAVWPLNNEGLLGVNIGGKWGFIDETGKIVIKPQFDFMRPFNEGVAAVNIGGKPVSKEALYLGQGGEWGYIDKTGKIVVSIQLADASDFSEGLAAVKLLNKWCYIEKTGKIVIHPLFDFAGHFSEGLAGVIIEKKLGYIDKSGNMVIKPQFEWGHWFSEGLAAVNFGGKGKWGYINRKGKTVIQPRFDRADPFNKGWPLGGQAAVMIDGSHHRIDRTGAIADDWKYVIESKYSLQYYNPENIAYPSTGIVRGWLKIVPTEEGKEWEIQRRKEKGLPIKGFENYDHEMELEEVDCSAKRIRLLSSVFYDTRGNVIDSFSGKGEWDHVVPESIGEAIYESMCSKWQVPSDKAK